MTANDCLRALPTSVAWRAANSAACCPVGCKVVLGWVCKARTPWLFKEVSPQSPFGLVLGDGGKDPYLRCLCFLLFKAGVRFAN
jgi:hypothetical protein